MCCLWTGARCETDAADGWCPYCASCWSPDSVCVVCAVHLLGPNPVPFFGTWKTILPVGVPESGTHFCPTFWFRFWQDFGSGVGLVLAPAGGESTICMVCVGDRCRGSAGPTVLATTVLHFQHSVANAFQPAMASAQMRLMCNCSDGQCWSMPRHRLHSDNCVAQIC